MNATRPGRMMCQRLSIADPERAIRLLDGSAVDLLSHRQEDGSWMS
jgi:hypothetical protein